MLKKCSICGEEKHASLEYFYKKLDGLMAKCKVCTSESDRLYREKNKEKITMRKKIHRTNNVNQYKQKDSEYYSKSRREILEKKKKYYLDNKEKKSEYNRNYRSLNNENLKINGKEYSQNNKGKIIAYQKQYRFLNRLQLNEKKRIERLEKRKADLSYRILHNLRSRVNLAVKGKLKSNKTIELIGCSIHLLRSHISAQFKQGMSWDNYGEWHVDHIRPCASFDLSDPEQQRLCFSYTNLQPLWANENLIKGAKWG